MGTLKDINYGVGKYLTTDDASSFPDIAVNRVNIDTLNFKLASNNAYALYNLKDGFVDAFEDTSGIDSGNSSNATRNASSYYSGAVSVSGATTGFTTTGANTWTAPDPAPPTIEVLVVAGGGGGGHGWYAGGGGGGGIVHSTAYPVTAGVTYDITVGAGGSGASSTSVKGSTGSDSVFNVNGEGSETTLLTAKGGGGGGSRSTSNDGDGAPGGSGGGSSDNESEPAWGNSNQTTSFGSPSIATGYGYRGGMGYSDAGAGGGGAGGVGGNNAGTTGGAGGIGRQFSNFSSWGTNISNTTSGARGYFSGGGGGGTNSYYSNTPAAGGYGGGGTGSVSGSGGAAVAANTGGGGGGAGGNSGGGAGASGFVGIHYASFNAYNNMTIVSNAQTAASQPDYARITLFAHPSTGTTTINTDVKAYASRDNGTTYTQITLANDGDYESGKKLFSGSVDISGQPAGTSMKYKVETLNQSASKETRIHGVSLQWS